MNQRRNNAAPGATESRDAADLPPMLEAIDRCATSVREPRDLKPLVDRIGQARIVMLGEASHGTHEFYNWRRMISEWLIVKHGFRFVAVEGDWPPCWELNRFIQTGEGASAREVLGRFDRWPTWMWANTDVVRLAEWMRTQNSTSPDGQKVGFFGLDLYSLFESTDAVLKELERINPFLARRAKRRYACFEPFHRDEKAYAHSLIHFPEGCEQEVLEMLQDLLRARLENAPDLELALFDATQNARIVADAEKYYRAMIFGDEDSWNIRDRHMLETLDLLLERHGEGAKAIVWAHNTHIGDYRATDMLGAGQVNIGGLARQQWGEREVALVGFGTHQGEVIASRAWDGPIEKMRLPEGKPGSYEALFHAAALRRGDSALFAVFDPEAKAGPLAESRGHRAVGVVYDPKHERHGNYVPTSLAKRYDAFAFIDKTQALEPLIQGFEKEEIPETWPMGQ